MQTISCYPPLWKLWKHRWSGEGFCAVNFPVCESPEVFVFDYHRERADTRRWKVL